MAAGIVDLELNEGETFVMAVEFWHDVDNTQPIDITDYTWDGAFQIGKDYIVMTATQLAVNVMEFSVAYSLMKNLSTQGKYDIDQLKDGESYRLLQGAVRINKEVTT